MEKKFIRRLVQEATAVKPWDMSNEVLYRICRENPTHEEQDAILSKVLLIGRVYAAAIERRRIFLDLDGDTFYLTRVAPLIAASSIDQWITKAKQTDPIMTDGLNVMLRVHELTTQLFTNISGLEKRSLASKYLHFHVPNLFFIYDSRALRGIRLLPRGATSPAPATMGGDTEYRRFASKCSRLTSYCLQEFGVDLKPRQLDNLLLSLATFH